jgi:hypothetical protein
MIKSISGFLPVAAKSLGLKVLVAGTVGIFGVGFVTQSVMANLNASAFNVSAQDIDSGSLSLTLASGTGSSGFSSSIAKMIPGDTQHRYVNYTQVGTSTAYLPKIRLTDVNSTLLTEDAVRGLQLTINRCTVAWTVTTGTPGVGTCSGVSSIVLATTALSSIKAADTALNSSNFLLTTGAVNFLQFVIVLPAGIDESVANGAAAAVTGSPLAISAIANAGGSVTYTVPSSTGLVAGQKIVITGATIVGFNGTKTIATVPNGTTFTVVDAATGATSTATGTLGTIQGLTASIVWTVSETQRVATTTNG